MKRCPVSTIDSLCNPKKIKPDKVILNNPVPVSILRKWKLFRRLDISFMKTIRIAFVFSFDDDVSGFLVTTADDVYVLGKQLVLIKELCQKNIVGFNITDYDYAAITESGNIYSWGVNSSGLLGHGNFDSYATPTLINALSGKIVKQFVMRDDFTIFLLEDGNVYVCGEMFTIGSAVNIPTKLDKLKNIISIGAGQMFCFALQEGGNLFFWGNNSSNQCQIFEPVEILNLPSMEKVLCGEFHACALSTDGEIFLWGESCRENSAFDFKHPVRVEMENVCDIAIPIYARTYFNACKTIDGSFYIWGCINQHVKVGPVHISRPLEVSCKSFHEIFLNYSKFQETHAPICWNSCEKGPGMQFEMALVHQVRHDYSNVTFIAEGKEIYACKSFLTLNSVYFAKMFAHEWKETTSGIIRLGDEIRFEVFFALLFYICSKDIILSKAKDLTELLTLSDCYLLSELHRDCELVLKEKVAVENVVEIYVIASESHLQNIQEFASVRSIGKPN